jgi:hypothetical protein
MLLRVRLETEVVVGFVITLELAEFTSSWIVVKVTDP